jgi:UrcA family protein
MEKIMTISNNLYRAAIWTLTLACAAANADTLPLIGSPVELVRFNDLNLDQPRDVSKLLKRVGAAADRVCGTHSFAARYNRNADYDICYRDTVASVVAHIDRPSVTVFFQQRRPDWASRKLIAQQ